MLEMSTKFKFNYKDYLTSYNCSKCISSNIRSLKIEKSIMEVSDKYIELSKMILKLNDEPIKLDKIPYIIKEIFVKFNELTTRFNKLYDVLREKV